MMLDSLGRHPELYGFPSETQMMPYIISQAPKFEDLENDDNFRAYWQFAINQLPKLQRHNHGVNPVIPDTWRSFPRSVGGIFDGIFQTLAAESEKKRWCEKTPDHVQHLPLLSQIFPDAKFVHMIRDGREVACSISRRQKRHPALIIYRWKKLVEMGQSEGKTLGDRYLEIKYEDLTSDPRSGMERVCAFLSLDFSTQVLRSKMPGSERRQQFAKDELDKIRANPLKWKTYFDKSTVDTLERIGGRALYGLGYPTSNSDGDEDPSVFKRKIWRGKDFATLILERANSSKHYDTIQKLAKKVLFSYREYRSKRH